MFDETNINKFGFFVAVILIALCVQTDSTEVFKCEQIGSGIEDGVYNCLKIPNTTKHSDYVEEISQLACTKIKNSILGTLLMKNNNHSDGVTKIFSKNSILQIENPILFKTFKFVMKLTSTIAK